MQYLPINTAPMHILLNYQLIFHTMNAWLYYNKVDETNFLSIANGKCLDIKEYKIIKLHKIRVMLLQA